MQTRDDKVIDDLMEQLIETGPEGMAAAFTAMLNPAMRLERERGGYANGYKSKKIDTRAGTLTVRVPESRGGDAPFYRRALEQGRRASRAVMLVIAQMYIPRSAGRACRRATSKRSWPSSGWRASPPPKSAAPRPSWTRRWKLGAPASSAPSLTCSSHGRS